MICDGRRSLWPRCSITLTEAAAALDAIRPIIRELYEPKPPLRVQLEYIRAQKIAEERGIILPSWEGLPPDN